MSEREPDLNMLAVLIESTFASPNINDDLDRAINLGAILLNEDQRSAIVTACNSHEALVAALEAMQQAYYDFHDAQSRTEPVTGRAGNANELAIAALSLARSGK